MDGYCVSCASSPVRTRGITGFYIRSPLTVAVLSSSYGKKKKRVSFPSTLCFCHNALYRLCQQQDALWDGDLYAARVRFGAFQRLPVSWHSCDGGTSGLSVSGEEGGRERRNRVFRKGAENSGGPLKLRNNI